MKNNNMNKNKGVYYVFCESRNVIFDVKKVEVEFDDERDLIKKLIEVSGVECNEEVIDDIISDDGVKECGYMLSEEVWGCDEEIFEREYKKFVNNNI